MSLFQEKKKTDLIRANLDTLLSLMKKYKDAGSSSSLFLPYAGPVTMTKTKDSIRLATLMGVNFYVHKIGADINGDIICPAWSAIPVTRNDQAFFLQKEIMIELHMYQDQDAPSASDDSLTNNLILRRAPPSPQGEDQPQTKSVKVQMISRCVC